MEEVCLTKSGGDRDLMVSAVQGSCVARMGVCVRVCVAQLFFKACVVVTQERKKPTRHQSPFNPLMSNLGPRTIFGQQCNYMWPAGQHTITTRPGPILLYSTCPAHVILQIPECSAGIFLRQ